jgi:hypothetical protein
MRLRTSKYLIRTALILFCFQFIGPAFVAQPSGTEIISDITTFHKQVAHSALASILFEKTEREAEEEDAGFVAFNGELFDFTVSYSNRISASQITQPLHTISGHLEEPPLFTLHCIFLI